MSYVKTGTLEAGPRIVSDIALPIALGLYSAGVTFVPWIPLQASLVLALLLPAVCLLVLAGPQRWLSLFFLTALLAPPLTFMIGDSGPHVALLFAAIGLLAGILYRSQWRVDTGPLFWSFVCFFSVLSASSGVALALSGWTIAAGSLMRVMLLGITAFVFFYSAYGPDSNQLRMTRLLYAAAVGSALFACLDFYFQWPPPAGYGPQFVWLDSGVFRRAQGVFYESSTLGNLCVFFLTMGLLSLLRPRHRPVPTIALFLGLPVIATALMLSYSRASMATLAISSSVLLWLHRDQLRVVPWRWRDFLLASVIIALVYAVFGEFLRGYLLRVWFTVPELFNSLDNALSGRIDVWSAVIQFLADHPWALFTGVGYKTLPYSEVAGRQLIVDNMYLSLLAETGFLGLACFLVLNFFVLRTCWKARASFHGMWLFSFWVGQMVQMTTGDLLTYWRVMPVYIWVLGLADRVNRLEYPVR